MLKNVATIFSFDKIVKLIRNYDRVRSDQIILIN